MPSNPISRILGDAVSLPLRLGRRHPAPGIDPLETAGQAPSDAGVVEVQTAGAPRRVVYDFFSGIEPELRNPGGSLPGANRWADALDPDHPHPVILMHGTGGGAQTNWGTYVPLLTGAGYSVFTMTYGAIPDVRWPLSAIGGMNHIADSAQEFGAFVERVCDATGADQVDVVGHSQGTLIPAYWAKFYGDPGRIRKYVSLAPLWQGTSAFSAARGVFRLLNVRLGLNPTRVLPCYSAAEMMAGSEVITALNADDGPYLPGIEYTNISTRYDEFVRPFTSGQVPGPPGTSVTNIVVQDGCSTDFSDHLAVCGSRRAASMVLNALAGETVEEVRCEVVVPFFGAAPLTRNA